MNRISLLRKERKLSQKELGVIIGVAQNTISNWENGNREPDYESLKKMAFFFNCSTDYLLGTTPFGFTFVFNQSDDKDLDWSGRPLIDKKKPTPSDGDGLSAEQMEIVKLFEAAPPALRAAALAVLKSAEGQDKALDEASKDE